jgi:hypothetical protein
MYFDTGKHNVYENMVPASKQASNHAQEKGLSSKRTALSTMTPFQAYIKTMTKMDFERESSKQQTQKSSHYRGTSHGATDRSNDNFFPAMKSAKDFSGINVS